MPEARTYLQPYPTQDVKNAEKVPEYAPVLPNMEEGIVAIYQKCVHLGCRVPWCQTSQWFECPCHGSKYSRVGEKKGGPAPRGLDQFVVTLERQQGHDRHQPRGHRRRRSAPTPPTRAPKVRRASDAPPVPSASRSSEEATVTLRTLLILINVAAVLTIIVVLGAKVLSVRRTPEERQPANLTPFYDDEVMEDTHLTRVLRWVLLFSTIIAIVLPLYWLLEPGRQSEESKGFEERAIERGATLYANASMEAYDSAKSLAVRQLPRRRRRRRCRARSCSRRRRRAIRTPTRSRRPGRPRR